MKPTRFSAVRRTVALAMVTLVAGGLATPGGRAAVPAAPPATAPATRAAAGSAGPVEAPPDPLVQRGTLRILRLPEADPGLPPGPGLEAVTTYCAMCHTPAYITLQPPLSRETWTAEVQKMRTAYSGPIPEERVGEIIEYLLSVRGAPAH